MKTVIHNIGTLAGILPEGTLRLEGEAMNNVGCIDNAYLTIEDGIITGFGPMDDDCVRGTATEFAGISCVTTLPAPMTLLSPMVMPGITSTPAPSQQFLPM